MLLCLNLGRSLSAKASECCRWSTENTISLSFVKDSPLQLQSSGLTWSVCLLLSLSQASLMQKKEEIWSLGSLCSVNWLISVKILDFFQHVFFFVMWDWHRLVNSHEDQKKLKTLGSCPVDPFLALPIWSYLHYCPFSAVTERVSFSLFKEQLCALESICAHTLRTSQSVVCHTCHSPLLVNVIISSLCLDLSLVQHSLYQPASPSGFCPQEPCVCCLPHLLDPWDLASCVPLPSAHTILKLFLPSSLYSWNPRDIS